MAASLARYPFQVDYGEGVVWEQARLLFTPRAYGPIDALPAMTFNYPPLFHLLARCLAATSHIRLLEAGRLVSVGALILLAFMTGELAAQSLRLDESKATRLRIRCLGGMMLFLPLSALAWGMMMRVDTLALLLSFVGLCFGTRAINSPRNIALASACFVLAVFTKQTMIAAPLACFSILFWLRPRVAMAGIAGCLLLGTVALCVLQFLTSGRFIEHVFRYNINSLNASQMSFLGHSIRECLLPAAAALFVFVERLPGAIRRLQAHSVQRRNGAWVSHNRDDLALVVSAAHAFFTTLLLPLVLKQGANINYTTEWQIAVCIVATSVLVGVCRQSTERSNESRQLSTFFVRVSLFPLAFAVQATANERTTDRVIRDTARFAELQALAAEIRAASGPVLSDDLSLLVYAGKDVQIEPALVRELTRAGVWDEQPLLTMITRRKFSLIVLDALPGSEAFDTKYSARVAVAVFKNYTPVRRSAGMTVLYARPSVGEKFVR